MPRPGGVLNRSSVYGILAAGLLTGGLETHVGSSAGFSAVQYPVHTQSRHFSRSAVPASGLAADPLGYS